MIFNPTEHRCAIVVNQNLSNGLAMNAASVIGVSLGNKVNNMVGNDLNSLDNMNYPGVIYAPFLLVCSLNLAVLMMNISRNYLNSNIKIFNWQG